MKKIGSVYLGCNTDSDIPNIMNKLVDTIKKFPIALITTFDSTEELRNSSSVKRSCEGLESDVGFKNSHLIVFRNKIWELLKKDEIFTGFDELWFFNAEPVITKPHDVTIVCPPEILEQSIDDMNDIADWMEKSGCVLGLGDGTGLNYVTTDLKIASKIENFGVEEI